MKLESQQQQQAEDREWGMGDGQSLIPSLQPPITDAELPDRPTTAEVARWLRKHPNAIYAWANKGLIPAKKVGRSWLFDKASLLKWAAGTE